MTAAAWPEVALPSAQAVDLGRDGCLLAFIEPVGLAVGRKLVISVHGSVGRTHAMGRVVRCERGTDFRTYVAVQFANLSDTDYDDLCAAAAIDLHAAAAH